MTDDRNHSGAADDPAERVTKDEVRRTGDPPLALTPAEDWVVEELRALIARLALRLDDVERFLPPLLAGGDDGTDDGFLNPRRADSNPDEYTDLSAWVGGYFAAVFSRPLGGQWRWCPRWNEHPEASERLDALWQTWQAAQRHPPLAMAAWLRDQLDHHLPVLLGPAGPFTGCSPERHEPHRALDVERRPH